MALRMLFPTLIVLLGGCDLRLTADEPADVDLRVRPEPDTRPVDIDGDIWLDVTTVRAHHIETGWHDIAEDVGLLNVDALIRDGEDWLERKELPAGRYDQLRLVLADAWVEHPDGSESDLAVPSGEQSGLKVHGIYCLDPGSDVLLDTTLAIGAAYDEERLWLRPSLQIDDAPSCADDDNASEHTGAPL